MSQHTIIVLIEKISLNYRHLLPDLAPWLTLSCSNYPYLEQISIVSKMFEPLKFDCTCNNSHVNRYQNVTVEPRPNIVFSAKAYERSADKLLNLILSPL